MYSQWNEQFSILLALFLSLDEYFMWGMVIETIIQNLNADKYIYLHKCDRQLNEKKHEGIFAFTQWSFRCCQSPQICTACADIFLCLNSADQLKVEPT
jgi:hypothetical protein